MNKIKNLEKLKKVSQDHLIKFYDELNEKEQNELASQLNDLNLDELNNLIPEYVLNQPKVEIPDDLTPAPFFHLDDEEQTEYYKKAILEGEKLISAGKVAALTVAGGQGSRLGFDGPKGTFPITPVENKTLFQYFSESILRINEKYSTSFSWYIMTSPINHNDTVNFFEENNYFNLPKTSVKFFTQGTMPAIGIDGKILLKSKSSLALAPNGHGGTLLALKKSGSLDTMAEDGVEHISYFQVDNPLASIASPLFIGLHALEKSEMSAITLPKTNPYEKLGNFCISKNRLNIIEYSDLPNELAEAVNNDGSLKFLAGSPAIHIISRVFTEQLTAGGSLSLPWHRADKKVEFLNNNGELENPKEINAVKLESFIFDALQLAKKTMILEAKREDEFAPTKNPTGIDSVESCREMLIDRDARWLEENGVCIPRKSDGTVDCIIELSPSKYLTADDVKELVSNENFKAPKKGETVYYG